MQCRLLLQTRLNLVIATLLVTSVTRTTNAQLLSDSTAVKLIRKGISDIYNLNFQDAENVLNVLNTKFPGHPAINLYSAISIYYEEYPLVPSDSLFKVFESQLHTGMHKCESMKNWIDNPELLLIDLSSRGLLLLCYSENEMHNEVASLVFATYKCIRKSFRYKSVYPDFWYFTGLYNYYREVYPELHPIYRPLALFFPKGDKKEGLFDLNYSAENSIVLKAESFSILSWIYAYYENDYSNALKYSRTIYQNYPSNLLFKGEYIKTLIFLRKYDEAEELILSSGNEHNKYFNGQLAVFKALLQENKYHNYKLARKYYEEGVSDLQYLLPRSKDFIKYASDGLKRINDNPLESPRS